MGVLAALGVLALSGWSPWNLSSSGVLGLRRPRLDPKQRFCPQCLSDISAGIFQVVCGECSSLSLSP